MSDQGLTTSFHHEGVTKAACGPRLRHMLRDVEEKQGLHRKHGNELIDGTRTNANFAFRLEPGPDGALVKRRIESIDEVEAHHAELLGRVRHTKTITDKESGDPREVPVALRKDASVAVELIFQLDPEWTGPAEEMTPEKRAQIQELFDVFYVEVAETFGAENVLALSEHWDETSPHVHAMAVPLVEDQLNVKLALTGSKKPKPSDAKAAYAARHDRLRVGLQEKGYQATMERVIENKRATLPAYKKSAKIATQAEQAKLDAKENAFRKGHRAKLAGYETENKRITERGQDVATRELAVGKGEKELSERVAAVSAREIAITGRESEATGALERATALMSAAEAMRTTAKKALIVANRVGNDLGAIARHMHMRPEDRRVFQQGAHDIKAAFATLLPNQGSISNDPEGLGT